jgi:hypothetical protein
MMTYMDCYENSPPLHLMIPIAFILLHLVSLVASNLSSHFTPFLPHQPHVILQYSIPTLGVQPSHKRRPHVPCHRCGYLYVTKVGLAHH